MIVQWRALLAVIALGALIGVGLYRFANWDGLASVLAALALPATLLLWTGVARATRP